MQQTPHWTQALATARLKFLTIGGADAKNTITKCRTLKAKLERIAVEYIWLDGKGQLRSKTRVLKAEEVTDTGMPPIWNYDGSSTYQRLTENSEVFLHPAVIYPDPLRGLPHILCICETSDEKNTRRIAREIFEQNKELEPMFGLEQEFFIYDKTTGKPLGWPKEPFSYPAAQGDYYCSVGAESIYARDFMEQVLGEALYCSIAITGYNWEVAPGQAEFQVCAIGIDAADQLTLLRYLLMRTGEMYNMVMNFDAKPFVDWNGSGLHTNYSTKPMREEGGWKHIEEALKRMEKTHLEDQALFGEGNEKRLTGIHETSSREVFTWGVASRAASVRIPTQTKEEGKGYLEDRRPAANVDPYLVTSNLYKVTALDGVSLGSK